MIEEPVVKAFRQTDETEFLRVEEHQVGCEPSHILREQV
jgi:hypothetical protein